VQAYYLPIMLSICPKHLSLIIILLNEKDSVVTIFTLLDA